MSKRSRSGPAVVILAAGKGKRMKSDRPKVLFDLSGWPLVRHVVAAAKALSPSRIVVVTGHRGADVRAALDGEDVAFVRQREQRGTGHAVRSAAKALAGHDGTVVVLLGDVPLVTEGTLRKLVRTHERAKAAATVLTVTAPDPGGYGRVLRDGKGRLAAIREHKDATAKERKVAEVNTGMMAFSAEALWPALGKLRADNAQGEMYLTDVPAMLLSEGLTVRAVMADSYDEVRGVNSLADLADVARESRLRILAGHMARGVRVVDPSTVHVDRGVEIGTGTTIFPFTVVTGEVRIGRGCEVGPFSHIRTGTRLRDGAQVGNFVEVKKTDIGERTKAKHLTYLGDAVIGAGTNIGCGTITANYDGKAKHRTDIGDGVHVGSGTVFVAPVKIGNHATTGAGAVVPAGRHVGDGETVVGVPARVLRIGKKRK